MTLDLDGRATRALATVAEPLGLVGRWRPRWGIHKVVVREHGRRRARASRREGQGPARLRHGRLRRRRARPMPREVARMLGVQRGARPARLRRGLGARLPRRAAVVRAGALASRRVLAPTSTPRRVNAVLDELEARGPRAACSRPASPTPTIVVERTRRHAPRRPDARDLACRCRAARSPAQAVPRRSAEAFDARLHRALHRPHDGRARRGHQLPRPLRRPDAARFRSSGAAGGGDLRCQAQGHRAAPGSTAASSTRRSTTATRCRPGDRIPARRSSRSARRPPSCRPATAWRSTRASTSASRSASPLPSAALVTPDMPLAQAIGADRSRSRSRSRSCGAASSPWSRRCG